MRKWMRYALMAVLCAGVGAAARAQACATPGCADARPCAAPGCGAKVRAAGKTCYAATPCSTCSGRDAGIACQRGNFCGQATCKSECGVRLPQCLGLGAPNVRVKAGKVYAWQGFPANCANPGQTVALVEKLAPAVVCVEDPVEYTIQVTNRGEAGLVNVVVTDTLPENFTLDRVEPETPVVDGKLVFTLAELKGNSARQFTVRGRATSTGCLVFAGEAVATFRFPLSLPVAVVQCRLDVALEAPDCAELCDAFDATVRVSNPGTAPSGETCVAVRLPEGLADARGERDLMFRVPNLRPGEAKAFALRGLKASKTGVFGLVAFAENARGLRSAAAADVKVRQPDLVVAKAATGKVYLDKKVAYEITVTNAGDCPARDVTVCDAFAADSAAVVLGAATPKPASSAKDGRAMTWALGTLRPGESKTIRYDVTAREAGTVKNTATVVARCAAPRTAEARTKVEGVPGLVSRVADDVDPAEIGELVTYTIDTTNQGRVANTNLVYVVTLDEGMEFVAAAGPGKRGHKVDGRSITFDALPSLANRQSARWTVTVRAAAPGDKRLRTSLMTDQFDKDRPVIVEAPTTFYQPEMVTTAGVPPAPAAVPAS